MMTAFPFVCCKWPSVKFVAVSDGEEIVARGGAEELGQHPIRKGLRCNAIESGFYSKSNVESEGYYT